jgi:hypothetical protein
MTRAERWLFAPGTARRLAALRIGLCSVLAVRLLLTRAVSLAGQPEALFRPRSFMHLFPTMPSRPVAIAVQLIGIVSAVLAAVGWRARLTLPAAWGAGVLLGGMATSLGKVVHNDVLLLLCLVPLLVAPTSDVWSIDARRRSVPAPDEPSVRYGWPVRTAMVVVAGSYLFVGLAKLLHSGLAWVLSDNLRWVLYAASDSRATPNSIALFIADRPVLAQLMAAATILFELTFPLVLWRPRAAWFYVPGALFFHLGIYLAMGLDYSAQAATVMVVLVDWPRLVHHVRRWTRAWPARLVRGPAV